MKKKILSLAGALMVSIGVVHAEAPASIKIEGQTVTLARYAKSYLGSGNIKVDVAAYKNAEGKEGAILLFHGVEGDWDGKAVNHQKAPPSFGGYEYVATFKGNPWHTFFARPDTSGTMKYRLFIPGVEGSVELIPSDGAAQLITPQEIAQTYLNQLKMK